MGKNYFQTFINKCMQQLKNTSIKIIQYSIPVSIFNGLSKIKNLNNTYIFDCRSTFYHDTVRVLPLNSQISETQYSRVPKGNTQKTPKFRTLWVPSPKIPMVFIHKPNPTHTRILVRVRVLPLGTRILGTQSPP